MADKKKNQPKNKPNEQEVLENDLLRDTREEISRERMIKFMSKWGIIFVSIAAVGVAVGFAYITWKQMEKEDISAKSDSYYYAVDKIVKLDKPSFADAKDKLEGLDGNIGYELLGEMAKAKILLLEDNEEEAKAVYSNLSGGKPELEIYQDYGHIMVAFRELESQEGLSEQSQRNIANIAAKDLGFKNLAVEVKALNSIKTGKKEEAAADLKNFLENTADISIAQKARLEKIVSHLETVN